MGVMQRSWVEAPLSVLQPCTVAAVLCPPVSWSIRGGVGPLGGRGALAAEPKVKLD